MREVHSPSPQPEDPDRALDPGLEEDPDIFMELIDRQFYQLSCDDAMVAITADYPGLLPASHVKKQKIPTPKLGSPFRHFTHHIHMAFYREGIRDALPSLWQHANRRHRGWAGQKGRRSGRRRRRKGIGKILPRGCRLSQNVMTPAFL